MSILGGIFTDIALWIFYGVLGIFFILFLIIMVRQIIKMDISGSYEWFMSLVEGDDTSTNRTSGKPGPASPQSSDSPALEEEQDPQTISYPKAWASTSEAKEASSHVEKS